MMFTFQFKGKEYSGTSPLEIVRALEADADRYPHRGRPIRVFLRWSLACQCEGIPPRDLDLSDRLEDDVLALSYLYLLDEYGAGKFLEGTRTRSKHARQNIPTGVP